MTAPEPGYTTVGRVLHVIDGDTAEVEIRKRVRVRLLKCWAPGLHGSQRDAGLIAREHLRQLCEGKLVRLHVPANDEGELATRFTFGRVLGFIYLEDDSNVSELMVESGHAARTKQRR